MNFGDLSIRRKLTWAIMVTSTTVLLLTGAAFLTYELATFRARTLANVRTVAEVLAVNSSAALAFQHTDDAHRVLQTLAAYPEVVQAALYTADGNVFEKYTTGAAPDVPA